MKISKTEINRIKTEIKKELKNELESYIKTEIEKQLNDLPDKDVILDISNKVIENFVRSLYFNRKLYKTNNIR